MRTGGLLAVIVDELADAAEPSLHLPAPMGDRLRAATDLLHEDPGRPVTLAELGRAAGVTDTSVACGWSNPSSFIDAFTEVVGQKPGRYQATLRARR